MEKYQVTGSKLRTMVIASAIIGSAKNEAFLMGILTTQAGQFQVNNNESPEAVDTVGMLREGDAVEIEMFEPFKPSSYVNNAGDTVHGATCQRFKILEVEGSAPTVINGLEGRKMKTPIIGKAKTPAAGGALAEDAKPEPEDRG